MTDMTTNSTSTDNWQKAGLMVRANSPTPAGTDASAGSQWAGAFITSGNGYSAQGRNLFGDGGSTWSATTGGIAPPTGAAGDSIFLRLIQVGDTTIGAWSSDGTTWNNEVTPDTQYVVEEFMKAMRVSDDPEAWAEYEAGGAFGVWGAYPSGVPNFVVLQDTVRVFSAESGELIESYELCLTKPWGLGQPIF